MKIVTIDNEEMVIEDVIAESYFASMYVCYLDLNMTPDAIPVLFRISEIKHYIDNFVNMDAEDIELINCDDLLDPILVAEYMCPDLTDKYRQLCRRISIHICQLLETGDPAEITKKYGLRNIMYRHH